MTQPTEPDVGKLVVMIAIAALSAVGTLAMVATLPLAWILIGSVVPIILWGWLLREIHRLLRFRGDDPEADAERDDRPWHL